MTRRLTPQETARHEAEVERAKTGQDAAFAYRLAAERSLELLASSHRLSETFQIYDNGVFGGDFGRRLLGSRGSTEGVLRVGDPAGRDIGRGGASDKESCSETAAAVAATAKQQQQ